MGRREAQSQELFQAAQLSKQQRKTALPLLFAVRIGIHVLPEKGNLPDPFRDEMLRLFNNIVGRAARFSSTRKRNDTIGAEVIASLHNGNESGKAAAEITRCLRRGRRLQVQLSGEYPRPALRAVDMLSNPGNLPCAKHQ